MPVQPRPLGVTTTYKSVHVRRSISYALVRIARWEYTLLCRVRPCGCSALSSSDKGMRSSAGGGPIATCELSLKELVARIEDGPVIESEKDAKAALEDKRVQIWLQQHKFPEG